MNEKGIAYTYHVPLNGHEEIVETEDIEYDEEIVEEVEDDEEYFMEMLPPPKNYRRDSLFDRRNRRMEKVAETVSGDNLNVIDIGKNVMLGTSDKTLNHLTLEKALKNGASESPFLGSISMENLVYGMMERGAEDGRFAMLGTSVMWNSLKSNIRDLRKSITEHTSAAYPEPRFDSIDVHMGNLPDYGKPYNIEAVGVFSNADLSYVFRQLRFRSTAKLLNKTKQFLKGYFILACRPRCMIWRYTLRRSGNSQKRAILNLPQTIVDGVIEFLLDLTGIGDATCSYEELNPDTPFYQSLGEDETIREQRYYEACKLKDSLTAFFRERITDCLNEIREMPFCLNTGTMISALRGRPQKNSTVMWKDYEAYLKTEHNLPTEANMKKRIAFEKKLCNVIPRSITIIRRSPARPPGCSRRPN
ncbi:unnamed protein product [Caenorhabditis nigoni]